MPTEEIQIAQGILNGIHLDGPVLGLAPIEGGFSADRKYHAVTENGAEYLLRLSAPETEEAKRVEFECVAALRKAGLLCAEPIKVGMSEVVAVLRHQRVSRCDGEPDQTEDVGLSVSERVQRTCYVLYTYILGDCLWDVLPDLPEADQHHLGEQSGGQLRLMHDALPAPGKVDDFKVRGRKFRTHLDQLQRADLSFEGQETAIRYVEEHLDLVRDRPTTFRHGDFHPGNLIVEGSELVGVIDFNRCDWGDPFDDFYKTAYFSAPRSSSWAQGLIDGYFGGLPPPEFWPIYNLYVAATLASDIAWSHKLYPDRLQEAFDRVNWIVATHDFVGGGEPAWMRVRAYR